jgi:hypothetical protein
MAEEPRATVRFLETRLRNVLRAILLLSHPPKGVEEDPPLERHASMETGRALACEIITIRSILRIIRCRIPREQKHVWRPTLQSRFIEDSEDGSRFIEDSVGVFEEMATTALGN